jgi:hypothetical protein
MPRNKLAASEKWPSGLFINETEANFATLVVSQRDSHCVQAPPCCSVNFIGLQTIQILLGTAGRASSIDRGMFCAAVREDGIGATGRGVAVGATRRGGGRMHEK